MVVEEVHYQDRGLGQTKDHRHRRHGWVDRLEQPIQQHCQRHVAQGHDRIANEAETKQSLRSHDVRCRGVGVRGHQEAAAHERFAADSTDDDDEIQDARRATSRADVPGSGSSPSFSRVSRIQPGSPRTCPSRSGASSSITPPPLVPSPNHSSTRVCSSASRAAPSAYPSTGRQLGLIVHPERGRPASSCAEKRSRRARSKRRAFERSLPLYLT